MLFFPNKENPTDVKVVSQAVDTLVTSHIALDKNDYDNKFLPLLKELEDLKESAQLIETSNQKNRYVKSSILGLGQFKIYAQGMGMYKYIIENEDLLVFISTTKFDTGTPQIKVEMRAHYLFALSYKKAYDLVLVMVNKMMGKSKNLCARIDLYSDIQGIKYTNFDELRFQTNYKSSDFNIRKHSKFKQITGYNFGSGDFVFRVYDKTNEIKLRKNKSFIMYKWILNGYKKDDTLPVWRHEVQYRRAELVKFMPKDLEDEVLFNFKQLDKLWNNATQKVKWVDLSNDEVLRISENQLKSDSIRKIFHRAKNNPDRLDFWSILRNWDNELTQQIAKYEYVKEPQSTTAKKFLKAYVGATYKACGTNPQELISLIDEVVKDLRDIYGISLHDYGELKTVSNFVDNAKIILNDGLVPEYDHTAQAFKLYSGLCQRLSKIDKPIQKELNRAEKVFKELGYSA